MKNLTLLQLEILEQSRISQAALDRILLLLIKESKDLNLSSLQRKVLDEDKVQVLHIKKGLRDLQINSYRKD